MTVFWGAQVNIRVLAKLLLFGIFCFGGSAVFQPQSAPASDANVPRFASLASSKVNVRVGPGKRYPISWVYVRSGWPVEIIAEYELWRQIRDVEGDTGWIHTSLLSNRRTILITDAQRPLYENPNEESSVILLADPGVQGRLLECDGHWCLVDIAGNEGWLKTTDFYGVHENEKIR
ncbi:SH3 domain-containing protein [Sneathiella glossodoripedis]|uniref:SH3 domain-containing protein n=1 Tax=Sneathiella glossodoripedis TaxID=418853 RepID=UPI00046F620E|nr:SH3 domain-containing protein [Sneathiella glossodoripedis]